MEGSLEQGATKDTAGGREFGCEFIALANGLPSFHIINDDTSFQNKVNTFKRKMFRRSRGLPIEGPGGGA